MVIGCVSTVQMVIGFGFEVVKITNPRRNNTNPTTPVTEEPRSPINEFIRNRRKGYQEMVDGLYVKYMNRLVGVQQQQAAYVQQQHHHHYYHPQPQYIYTQQQKYYYPPTTVNNPAAESSMQDEYELGVSAEDEEIPVSPTDEREEEEEEEESFQRDYMKNTDFDDEYKN
ncbi:1229_t:CDS:2 [Ambispora gerdemannii]|uniref:1229_t:CDS:1 n=1 Tax=Ambispora gerdemannii TaxID=144530 RepID=A0A9N9BYI5_9GLOM|nr:1229_t:CDS:2 [Ambispora gerdemannii]